MIKSAAIAALTEMRLTVSDGISWYMIANISNVVSLASRAIRKAYFEPTLFHNPRITAWIHRPVPLTNKTFSESHRNS